MAQNFSGALKIMDLDDFIAPSQVRPQQLPSQPFRHLPSCAARANGEGSPGSRGLCSRAAATAG